MGRVAHDPPHSTEVSRDPRRVASSRPKARRLSGDTLDESREDFIESRVSGVTSPLGNTLSRRP